MKWETEKPKRPIRVNPDSNDRLEPYRHKHPRTLEQIQTEKLEKDLLEEDN
jgi:hypothetical protein